MKFLLILLASALTVIAGESPFIIPDSIRQNLPKELIKIVQKAEEDYKAVQDGKKPVHAKYIEGSYALDGGSKVFQGERYKIVVQHRVGVLLEVAGYVYGPILSFDEDISIIEVSDLRFYSREELSKLRARHSDPKSEAEQATPSNGDKPSK